MRRLVSVGLLSVLGVAVILAAAFMLRLSRGPVALTFLKSPLENVINSNLGGYRVEIDDAVIERDRASGQPRLRLRNVLLQDATGAVIARAPRAAIGIDGKKILTGRLVPRQLELIGPRIEFYRHLDGTLSLGFGRKAAGEFDAAAAEEGSAARPASEDTREEPQEDSATAMQLREFLTKELMSVGNGTTAVSTLDTVKISNASLALFDEFNQARWNAPAANLVFRRMPYGFALFADITIATDNEPWRSELVANYRTETRSFAVSARIFDLVPADLSNKVFALHRLAQVRLPLSGKAEMELTEDGVITKATAELTAAEGMIGFPGYIADPIAITEGLLRVDLDTSTGTFLIKDSTLVVGSTQAQIQGRIFPRRLQDGRLSALEIAFSARNFAMSSAPAAGDTLQFERVELKGLASVNESRFDIEDLILQTGSAGVRVRGSFEGQEQAIGVRLSGVVRDLPLEVVQKLWPPIVAPNTRKWVNANVTRGHVPDGRFVINVPGNVIAGAFRGIPIPDEMIDLTFTLRDIETRYFARLPPISGARGSGRLRGNRFDLSLEDGTVSLPSGGRLAFLKGTLETPTLHARVIPTRIVVDAKGGAREFVELLDQEPLRYPSAANIDPERTGGDADVRIEVGLMFQKGRKPIIDMKASAQVSDVRLSGIFEQADIAGGNLSFAYGAGRISAKGTVQLNKVPTLIEWSRNIAKNATGAEMLYLESELDDRERLKLGLDMGGFVRGPVRIKLNAEQPRGKLGKAKVEAVLTKAELRIDAMRWWRPPGIESQASFDVDFTDPDNRLISNLRITGGNLMITGDVRLNAKGEVLAADFSKIVLDEENRFRMKLRRKDGMAVASVSGAAFDARHLINGMFKQDAAAVAGKKPTTSPLPVTIDAQFDRVYANRGEVLTGVKGKLTVLHNTVQEADIQGAFLSGAPATVKISPAGQQRDMRVVIADAGAALRAANLYSKASGGQLELSAQLGNVADPSIRRGMLVIRNFAVRDETALREIDRSNKTKAATGPRNQGFTFTRLTVPFSSDRAFVRIGDSLLKGPEMGATVQGLIRKRDGAIDIGGTIIPAYALNSALGEVPLLGDILTGGKGQGVFGLTFALRGTMQKPQFIVNPVSALAPGFLRRIFEIGGNYPEPGQKRSRPPSERTN